ncbi:MAG: hypothetical protein ACRDPS_16785 [Nocardioides sp.]|uniref:hypothetical protein n=1 Tax=Nocardioides sp. TaxID=35761 RepID=UPI003D6BC0AD
MSAKIEPPTTENTSLGGAAGAGPGEPGRGDETEQLPDEPKYGVTYNRSWAWTDLAHPAVKGEHGDCIHCLHLSHDAIDEAVETGRRTATIERDGHSLTVHEMVGTSGISYIEPEERARRAEDRRRQAAMVAAGASARDLRLRENAQAANDDRKEH